MHCAGIMIKRALHIGNFSYATVFALKRKGGGCSLVLQENQGVLDLFINCLRVRFRTRGDDLPVLCTRVPLLTIHFEVIGKN